MPGQKWCPRKKHWVDPDEFYRGNSWCKACKNEYSRQVYDFRLAKQEKKKRRYITKTSTPRYQELLLEQEGKCAICLTPTLLFVDALSNGTPFALLCNECRNIVARMENDVYRHQMYGYILDKQEN